MPVEDLTRRGHDVSCPYRCSAGGTLGCGDRAGSGNHSAGSDGEDDPENDVGQKARAAANQEQDPDETDDGRIHIEIIGEARANAGDFLVGA